MKKLTCLLILVSFLYFTTSAYAVPSFARNEGLACSVCHVGFPKLNAVGIAYKQNGYKFTENDNYMWNRSVPLGGIIKFRNTKKTNSISAEVHEVELFSAGVITPSISYYTAIEAEDEAFEPAEAFIIVNNLALDSNRINLRVGRFANELPYISDMRRLTIQHYFSPATLDNTGYEVNGYTNGVRYALGLGNDEMVGVDGIKNNLRAGYGWVTYDIAGNTIGTRYSTTKAGDSVDEAKSNNEFDITLDLHIQDYNIILGYYNQNNKDRSALVELIFNTTENNLTTVRYEVEDVNNINIKNTRYVVSNSYYIAPNVSIIGEHSTTNGVKKVVTALTIGF